MELSLKDAISMLDVVKTLDKWSLILWLSLTVPLYYVAFKKLIPEPQVGDKLSLGQRIAQFISIPSVEAYVIFLSVALFIIGNIIAVIGTGEKERIRNSGWELKNYMINSGYYAMPLSDIIGKTKMKEDDIKTIASQFPKEFSLTYTSNGDPKAKENITLILSDSISKNMLLVRSEKILASYLNNPAVLVENGIRHFDSLFAQNNLFTYPVIYKLIADSGHRYSFNLMDTVNHPPDPRKGFGIVKLKK